MLLGWLLCLFVFSMLTEAVTAGPDSSTLADLLIEDISSGSQSCGRAQKYAGAAAVHDEDADLRFIAKIGSHGWNAQNAERDFHTFVRRSKRCVDVALKFIPVRMYDPSTCEVKEVMHPIIPPNTFARALYKQEGKEGFRKLLFGSVDASSYWTHVQTHCPWFAGRKTGDFDTLCGISIHGDDVKTYKNTDGKVVVISWTSDFCQELSLSRFYTIAVVPLHHVCSPIAAYTWNVCCAVSS